jgi:DNA polymerase sigma
MLIVAFLEMNHDRYSEPHPLGNQFLDLLRLYGTDINLQSVGVAVNPPGFFGAEILRYATGEDAEPAYRRGQRSLISAKRTAAAKGNLPVDRRLCIQDPTQFMNDLGRSCIRTPELQNALTVAHQRLSHACDTWEGPERNSSILTTAFQANFDELDKFRGQVVRQMD